jgi:hypothetical protein
MLIKNFTNPYQHDNYVAKKKKKNLFELFIASGETGN